MAEGGESAKRQVAHKSQIAEILNGTYVKEDGWLPNYIDTGSKKISRANLMGVLVSKDADPQSGAVTLLLDDGTGRISLRFFDFSQGFAVGDIVNVVGRPREFGSERYVVPEIIKKVTNPKWIELRKLELTKTKQEEITAKREEKKTEAHQATSRQTVTEEGLEVEDEDLSDSTNPLSKVFEAIRSLDSGAGVGFDEIIVKTRIDDVDAPIKRLLEQGDIFEIKPGRYKVLE